MSHTQVLWGHASLALKPSLSWLTAVTSAASGQLARFSARDTAMLLWALAALGFPPERQLLPQLLGGLSMSSCKLKSATPQVSNPSSHAGEPSCGGWQQLKFSCTARLAPQ